MLINLAIISVLRRRLNQQFLLGRKTKEKQKKWRGVFLLFVLLIFPVVARSAPPTNIDWTEEVQLHDGTIIVVKRHEELGATGFPLTHRGLRKFWQFCYEPMGIKWRSKPEYFPETFDIVDGKAYVKVSMGGCESCMLQGYPSTDAIYFVWEGNAWKQISYEQFPKGLRFNMLGSDHYDDDGTRDVRGFLTLEEKKKRDRYIYYTMSRKPEITGLNETPAMKGMCHKCQSVHGQTTDTSEVFLPMAEKNCH